MEVVIVGGGPIGCWTALQIARRRPGASIVVYERHAQYQRNHVMSVDRRSFTSWAKSWAADPDLLHALFASRATCRDGTTVDETAAGTGRRAIHLPASVDIRTLDMERLLRKACEARGVRFVRREIKRPADAMDLHPTCRWFIAADGAHSRMRTALWGRSHLRQRDIHPSLDFNYEAHGQPGYLRVNTYMTMGHVYAENIGLQQDGKSSVNIRIIVNQAQYDALPQATFKKPLVFSPGADHWPGVAACRLYGRTPQDDFLELMRLRALHAGERPTDAPITVTKIHLSQYHARRFSRRVRHGGRDRAWFLVGDAAMGMPFYRAVNSGMVLGSQLACLLTSPLVPARAKGSLYDGLTRPMRIIREGVRIRRREMLITLVKDVARPALLRVMRSPLGPVLAGPLDAVVSYAKYGRLLRAADAAR